MLKKIPKPRIGDSVEKVDDSRYFGMVIGLRPPKEVQVRWDDVEPSEIKTEKIVDLALVSRPYYHVSAKMLKEVV